MRGLLAAGLALVGLCLFGRWLATRSLDPEDPEVQRWAAGQPPRPLPAIDDMDREQLAHLAQRLMERQRFEESARRADRVWWLLGGAALTAIAQLLGRAWLAFG